MLLLLTDVSMLLDAEIVKRDRHSVNEQTGQTAGRPASPGS